MNKKNNFLYYILILVLIIICLYFLFYIKKIYKSNNNTNYIVNNNDVFEYIKNINENDVFPDINVISYTKLKKYIDDNFLNFNYNYNKNKNVAFTMLLPKYLNGNNINKILLNNTDPLNFMDKSSINLVEFKNNKLNIFGTISVVNTSLELDARSINIFFTNKTKNLKPIKEKTMFFVSGFVGDMLYIDSETNNITRVKVIRNSNLYYMFSFTYKNIYEYKNYAKDISVMFASIEFNNPLKKISNIKFDLYNLVNNNKNIATIIYPDNFNIKHKYINKIKCFDVKINSKNGHDLYNIRFYEDNNDSNINILNKYLDELKEKTGLVFDNNTDTIYNENNIIIVKLKNKKDNNGNPIDVFIKIYSSGNKKILGSIITLKLEDKYYLLYQETERYLSIFMLSSMVSFFENNNIRNTEWIKLIQ